MRIENPLFFIPLVDLLSTSAFLAGNFVAQGRLVAGEPSSVLRSIYAYSRTGSIMPLTLIMMAGRLLNGGLLRNLYARVNTRGHTMANVRR